MALKVLMTLHNAGRSVIPNFKFLASGISITGIIAIEKIGCIPVSTSPSHRHAMDSYNSDESLEDQTDYQETGVLLGYASREATEDAVSHLGGFPVRTLIPPSEYFNITNEHFIDMAKSFDPAISGTCEM